MFPSICRERVHRIATAVITSAHHTGHGVQLFWYGTQDRDESVVPLLCAAV